MPRIITLKYPANCQDCGTYLPPGTRAKWYGKGKVYGLDCHSKKTAHDCLPGESFNYQDEPLGLTYSRLDKHGVYTPDGQKIGSTCGCEDYPCCGH